MAGQVAGASSFQTRINTLTANQEITDEAAKGVASQVASVAAELKVELRADQQALAAAERNLDGFSYPERIGGYFKSIVNITTPARAASEAVDALREEVKSDESALRSANYQVEWFSDLSGNKARQQAEEEAAERQRQADEYLRIQCISGNASSGCGSVAPGFATNANW